MHANVSFLKGAPSTTWRGVPASQSSSSPDWSPIQATTWRGRHHFNHPHHQTTTSQEVPLPCGYQLEWSLYVVNSAAPPKWVRGKSGGPCHLYMFDKQDNTKKKARWTSPRTRMVPAIILFQSIVSISLAFISDAHHFMQLSVLVRMGLFHLPFPPMLESF